MKVVFAEPTHQCNTSETDDGVPNDFQNVSSLRATQREDGVPDDMEFIEREDGVPDAPESVDPTAPTLHSVRLEKSASVSGKLGLSITVLENGQRLLLVGHAGAIITGISKDGAAAANGQLMVNDQILNIDGQTVFNMAPDDVRVVLKATGDEVIFVIARAAVTAAPTDVIPLPEILTTTAGHPFQASADLGAPAAVITTLGSVLEGWRGALADVLPGINDTERELMRDEALEEVRATRRG